MESIVSSQAAALAPTLRRISKPGPGWTSLCDSPFETLPYVEFIPEQEPIPLWVPQFSSDLVRSHSIDRDIGMLVLSLNHPRCRYEDEHSVLSSRAGFAYIAGHPLQIMHDSCLKRALSADFDTDRLMDEVKRAWDDMLGFFLIAVRTGQRQLAARSPTVLDDFVEIPVDALIYFEVCDWWAGTARTKDGSRLFSMHLLPTHSDDTAEPFSDQLQRSAGLAQVVEGKHESGKPPRKKGVRKPGVERALRALMELYSDGIPQELTVRDIHEKVREHVRKKAAPNIALDDKTIKAARTEYAQRRAPSGIVGNSRES
jgi:hypothetical protein